MRCWSVLGRVIAALMLCMCVMGLAVAARVNSPLVGKWLATPDDDTRISYEFKADGSVFWMYEKGTIWSGISGRYRINANAQPMQVDLYDFADPDMEGVTLKGIFVLDEANQLRMVAARDERPVNFDSGVVQFTRLTESNATSKSGTSRSSKD